MSQMVGANGLPVSEPTDGLGAWNLFLCRACGLIYDEGEGDPDGGLSPGTRFSDIPDDWECPICGVTKTDFEPYQRREKVAAPAIGAVRLRQPGIVIVGAGLAGWSVAQALRALDGAVPITLVTSCPGDVYHKPELSVALSRGISPDRLRRETGHDAATRLDVRLMAGTLAIGLSPGVKRLRTTRGTVPYTNIVLAQGARSALPPNLAPNLCWRINSLAAWSDLHGALSRGPRRVAIVGAGMIGCELSEDLARAGHAVTLLNVMPFPLPGLLPDPAAERLLAGFTSLGIAYRGSVEISGLARRADGGVTVAVANGPDGEADLVIAATGLATETRLVRSAGLAFDRGIAVDPATLRTSADHVYALGDCVSFDGAPCRFIEPIPKQADAVAHAILGRPHGGYAHATPIIRLKTQSTPIVLHGVPSPSAAWRTIEDTETRLVMEQSGSGVRLTAETRRAA